MNIPIKPLILPFFLSAVAFAAETLPESVYTDGWCTKMGGQVEAVMPDGTRCDCLTSTHAIEFDFAHKWYEAIGQALYYGLQTGKRPGIVLILKTPKDNRYWIRLNTTIQHYNLPIDTWKIDPKN